MQISQIRLDVALKDLANAMPIACHSYSILLESKKFFFAIFVFLLALCLELIISNSHKIIIFIVSER